MNKQAKEVLEQYIHDDSKHFYMFTPTGSVSTGEDLIEEACRLVEDEFELYTQKVEDDGFIPADTSTVWVVQWIDKVLELHTEVAKVKGEWEEIE